MGNYKSVEEKKEETVVIAQNGANNARNEHWEEKIEIYGIVTISLIAIILIFSIFILYKRCNRGIKKWARRELNSVVVVSPEKTTTQQPNSLSAPSSAQQTFQ